MKLCDCFTNTFHTFKIHKGTVSLDTKDSERRIYKDYIKITVLPDENGEYADELMDKRFEIVEADEYEAIHYIRKAARHEGDYVGAAKGNAEFLLAKCAEEGLGRMYDREKAIELYIRAAEHGSYDAFKKLKTLPPYEVDKARARLRMKPANSRKRIGESDEDDD